MVKNRKSILRVLGWTGSLFMILASPFLFEFFVEKVAGISEMARPEYAVLGAAAFLLGLIVVMFAFRGRAVVAFFVLLLLVVSTVAVAEKVVLPKLDTRISARSSARRLQADDPSFRSVYTYQLSRNWQYGLNFYTNREIPEWAPGSGEPEWILGFVPTRQFLNDYDIEIWQISPEFSPPLMVFHHK
jgi:hypothetical protein